MGMRLVNREDVKEFPDGDGGKLVLMARVTGTQFGLLGETVKEEQFELVKKLGISLEDAQAAARKNKKPKSKKDSEEDVEDDELTYLKNKSAKARRFRFDCVAVNMTISNGDELEEVIDISAMGHTYEKLDASSQAWVDKQVSEVWMDSWVSSAEKNLLSS